MFQHFPDPLNISDRIFSFIYVKVQVCDALINRLDYLALVLVASCIYKQYNNPNALGFRLQGTQEPRAKSQRFPFSLNHLYVWL